MQLEEQANALGRQRDELVRAQAELMDDAESCERASRYKSEFLANMSHELRTPLNSSLILAKLLADNKRGQPDRASRSRYAETIYAAGNDLLTLINDILDLSKIEAGKHRAAAGGRRRSTRWRERCATPSSRWRAQKGLAFARRARARRAGEPAHRRQRLEQMLKNLLSNAFKFTERGEVRADASQRRGDRVAFAVSDTGIGIAAEQQELIFEAFRQADGTTSRGSAAPGWACRSRASWRACWAATSTLESEPGQGSASR